MAKGINFICLIKVLYKKTKAHHLKYFNFDFIMLIFSNPQIYMATVADAASIVALLNSAYRGESSKQGWTTEAHLIAGNVRTDEKDMLNIMAQPNSVVLKSVNEQDEVIGCVNLQQHDNKIYLGMLSVSPNLQGAGIGKQLLKAAEEYALYLQCTAIYMMVITARTELISWYNRYGYYDTGGRKPFTQDDLTGRHLQPLEFMMLEKIIAAA